MKNIEKLEKLESGVGTETFKIILDVVGGDVLRFPSRLEHYNRERRNASIKDDRLSGADWSQLSIKYDLSIDRVRKICNSS